MFFFCYSSTNCIPLSWFQVLSFNCLLFLFSRCSCVLFYILWCSRFCPFSLCQPIIFSSLWTSLPSIFFSLIVFFLVFWCLSFLSLAGDGLFLWSRCFLFPVFCHFGRLFLVFSLCSLFLFWRRLYILSLDILLSSPVFQSSFHIWTDQHSFVAAINFISISNVWTQLTNLTHDVVCFSSTSSLPLCRNLFSVPRLTQ